MGKLSIRASVPVAGGNIETGLSLLSFVEDNVTIIYSAELDLVGSGYDLNQAKASFWEALSEFFRYAMNKGTLWSELKRLGWQVKGSKKNRKTTPPQFAAMLRSNKEFEDIILNKNYTKFTERVQIPQFA